MYQVDWTPAALRQLVQIHNQADQAEQAEIRAAARRINDALINSASDAGESRVDHFRVVIDGPLIVNCWVGRDDYIDVAAVIHVRRNRPRLP